MYRSTVLVFILVLTASSLLAAKPAFAQIPTPSVPEFTLTFEAHPYDVPPITTTTTTVDPYTGNKTVTVITQPGYHVENKSIDITIKNQNYSYSFNGTDYWLSYYVRAKGHFTESWTELSRLTYFWSNSDYLVYWISAEDYPSGGQVDFQVKANVIYPSWVFVADHPLYPQFGGHYEQITSTDGTSGWSATQTILIPLPSQSPSPSPSPSHTPSPLSILSPTPTLSPSPSVPEFPSWIIPPLLVVTLFSVGVIRKRKSKPTAN